MSHSKIQIQFSFSDGSSIDYDYNLIYSINPKIIITKSTINESGKYIIKLPPRIKKEDLVEFLLLYMKNNKPEDNIKFFNESRNKFLPIINDKNKLESLLRILLFFNNENFINFLINNIFIPEMKKDKLIYFLLFSQKLIEINKKNDSEISSSYMNLFHLCIEKIENDEKYVIDNYEKLKILGKEKIRKIIDKIFSNLLFSNCLLNTEEESENESSDIVVSDDDSNIDETSILNENNNNNNGLVRNKLGDESEENNIGVEYNGINKSYGSIKKENSHILNIKDYRKLIKILMDISNNHNIYELLSYEYINILSHESICDLNGYNKKNVFQKKIYLNNIKNNNLIYEEIPLNIVINNKTVYFVIFFQPFERSINVCIKIKDNLLDSDNKLFKHLDDRDYCFKLFTFYVTVQICKGNNIFNTKKNNTIISLTNNKSMYNIFKSSINSDFPIDKLSSEINDQFFIIKSEIKICSIYTAIISYLLQDFYSFYKDDHLSKLSKQLFILIINNKYLDKKNSNDIVNSILIWLNDDVNIKEDITEIFYNINWDNVDEALIFELIVKYSHFIANNESLQIMFFKIFEEKYGDCPMVKSLINNIISASKKIKYEQIFTQMKRNVKFNNAFINFNSFYVTNNNNNVINNKLNEKQKIENKFFTFGDNSKNKTIIMNKNNENDIIKISKEKNKVIRKNKSNDFKFVKKNINLNKIEMQQEKEKIIIKDENNIINKNDESKKHNNLIINYTNPAKIKNNLKNIKLEKPIKPNLKIIIKDMQNDNILPNKEKQKENKINIKKINTPKLIKKITNKNFNRNNKIKTNLTKKSTSEFMRFVLNSSNSIFSNFNNSFNKSFNNLKKFK